MYKKLFLMGTILFGFLCSVTLGGFDQKPQQEKMFNHAQDVNQFDINSEIEAIRQVRVEMNAAIQAAGNDTQKINMEQYRNRENEIFNQLKVRRRAQYANVRLEASRWGRAVARDLNRPIALPRNIEADLRIDCPNSEEWVLISETPNFVVNDKKVSYHGAAEVLNPRVEGNGYTIHFHVKRPDYGHAPSVLDVTIYATYRYNDATLNRKVDEDMVILRNRIEAALK